MIKLQRKGYLDSLTLLWDGDDVDVSADGDDKDAQVKGSNG